jgi:hypothetical protein
VDDCLDAGHWLPVPVRHKGTSSRSARADGGLEIAGCYQIDLGAEDGLQVGLDPS